MTPHHVQSTVLPSQRFCAPGRFASPEMRRIARIVVQSALLAAVWFAADFLSRRFHLPVPGGVIGLVAMLALLFCGGIAPSTIKAGADWLLSDMLLFFIPATVAAVQYGGLFRSDGWRLALVVVGGTLLVMVAVALAVDQAARFERCLALRRRRAVRVARAARVVHVIHESDRI